MGKWLAGRSVLVGLVASLVVVSVPVMGQEEEPQEPEESESRRGRGQVVPPALIEDRQAEYTDEAVEARVEGQVVLELVIDASGEVREVKVVEGLGYGLDEAAVAAARQFRFRPATVDGEPTPVALNFAIRFSLPIMPATFEGRLADPETGEGIEGARVVIEGVGEGFGEEPPLASTRTDSDGRFRIEEMPPGQYQVRLRVEEYSDFETDIELVDGQTTEVEYSLPKELENLTGLIREAGTRTPLAGMDLALLEPETGETVREEFSRRGGEFGFRGVPPGEYLLRVSGSEYFTASFEVEIVAGEVTEGTFYIRAEGYDEFTVRTTAERERAEVNRQTVQLEEVRRIPGTGGDVVRVVQNLPGVARPSFVGGQIIVRGSAPEDTKIYLEGDEIPLAFHFLGGPAVLNTEMVSAIDFYPGNFSARYGRATAGVIDIQTRSPQTDRFHGFAEIDLLDASAIVEGPINENWSFAIAGRRSYYDLFLPPILEALESDVFVAPSYYDYQSWTTYRSDSGNHKLELFIYGSNDRLELLLADDSPEGDANIQTTGLDFDNSFHRGQVKWTWTPEELPVESTLMGSFGVNSFGLEFSEDLFFLLDYYTSYVRQDTRFEIAEELTLRAGIDARFGNVLYSFAIPEVDGAGGGPSFLGDAFGEERSTWELLPAVYTELDYKLFDRLTLVPGVRADYYGPVNEVSVSPRFSTRFEFTDELLAKGGVGFFTQPPLPGETEEDFGNPEITYEKAMHYALGAEWRPRDYLELDTTLFYRDNYDLVSSTDAETIDEEGNREPVVLDNDGEGRAYGWEVLLRHYPRNNFFGWVAYTLSRSELLNRDDEWVPFNFDQTHILTLVAGYNLPWNLDVSARFRLVTGNPDTPVVGAAFDADSDSYSPIRGPRNSIRSATFHQLDLRVDKTFIFDTWRLAAYLDVSNVYNAVNQEGTRYNFDYTDSEPLRGLPILPTLGVSARF